MAAPFTQGNRQRISRNRGWLFAVGAGIFGVDRFAELRLCLLHIHAGELSRRHGAVAAAAEIFHDYLDIQIAVGTRRDIDAVLSAVEDNKRGFYAADFKQFVRRLSAEQSRVLRTGCGAGYGTAPVDILVGYYLAALAVALD